MCGTIEDPGKCPNGSCGKAWTMQLMHNYSDYNNKQLVKMQVCVALCSSACCHAGVACNMPQQNKASLSNACSCKTVQFDCTVCAHRVISDSSSADWSCGVKQCCQQYLTPCKTRAILQPCKVKPSRFTNCCRKAQTRFLKGRLLTQ